MSEVREGAPPKKSRPGEGAAADKNHFIRDSNTVIEGRFGAQRDGIAQADRVVSLIKRGLAAFDEILKHEPPDAIGARAYWIRIQRHIAACFQRRRA